MDALLVDGLGVRAIDGTARQGSAFAYGSSFSRGVELRHAGGRTVHVSGTASIDPAGRSTHLEDPSAQFCDMLLDVAAVLAEGGLGLSDVVQSTLFCKTQAAHDAAVQALDLFGIPRPPMVQVRADVCRAELLIEMEVIAAR